MANWDWRKVNLLDLKPDKNNEKITEILKDNQVTCCASGNGQIIVCDNQGKIHIFDQSWQCISYKGHDMSIILCCLSINDNLLVTVSLEEVNEIIKVWNLTKKSKDYGAHCLRKATTQLLSTPTALAVSDNGLYMAIGYKFGSITLYRGDVGRDNKKTLTKLCCSNSAIIGLAFKVREKFLHMFVCSDTSVIVYNIKNKDEEIENVLDSEPKKPTRCYAFQNCQQSVNQLNFIVGRDDAIYCFNEDGRGPCYALEGQKIFVEWYRTSLVTISKLPNMNTTKQSLIVIDIQDNIIIFNSIIDEVAAVFKEFGSCYILTKKNVLFRLCEKDLQSKLNVLFKKNQYEVAVSIAIRQQYDAEGLASIYKQYGDHLYNKRDYEGAIENYTKTLGYVEPSFVIRKFLDSKHTKFLTTYLLILHKKSKAAPSHHTTLLINCLTRLELKEGLRNFFVKDKHPNIMFDWDMAINICRKTSVDLALELSKANHKHDSAVNILIEDLKAYDDALQYISKLSSNEADYLLEKYGITLLEKSPEKTTEILKQFCIQNPISANIYETLINDEELLNCSNPKHLKTFFKNSEKLIEYLESIIKSTSELQKIKPVIFNTLIELHLDKWKANSNIESRLLELLNLYEGYYEMDHVLILCKLFNFVAGLIWIYEETRLYHLVLRYHLLNKNYDELLKFCERNGSCDPSLWLQFLNGLKNDDYAPPDLLVIVLSYIHTSTEKSQSPLQILHYLAAKDKKINLSNVGDYFLHVLKKELQITNQEDIKVNQFRQSVEKLKIEIKNVRSKPLEFKNTMCDQCQQQLTMPVVYFLCKHSFHQECLKLYSDNEKDCIICHESHYQLKNELRAQSEFRNALDPFYKKLVNSQQPFSEVSQYFGYELFKKVRDSSSIESEKHLTKILGISEGTICILEVKTKQITTAESNFPKSGGRLRTEEAYQHSRTAEKQTFPILKQSNIPSETSKKIFKSESTNPFEKDDYNYRTQSSNSKSINLKTENINEETIRTRRNIKSIELYNNNLNPFA